MIQNQILYTARRTCQVHFFASFILNSGQNIAYKFMQLFAGILSMTTAYAFVGVRYVVFAALFVDDDIP